MMACSLMNVSIICGHTVRGQHAVPAAKPSLTTHNRNSNFCLGSYKKLQNISCPRFLRYKSEIKPWNDGVGGEHTAWLLSGRRGHPASRGQHPAWPWSPPSASEAVGWPAPCVTLRGGGHALLSTRPASFLSRAGGTASGWAAAPSAAPSGREKGRHSVAASAAMRAALGAATGKAGYLLAHAHTLQGSQHGDLASPAWSEHRLECRAGVRQLGHA